MYFTRQMIATAEERYGSPATYNMNCEINEREYGLIKSSQRDARKHDVTLAVFGEPGVLVIAKPWYTKGLYRLPSGGLKPGESLEEGAARECWEETGVAMKLLRYHLRIDVDFRFGEKSIPWTSHVFSATYVSGDVKPHDTEEIREARWSPMSEMLKHRELMLQSKVSGLKYRAELQDKFLDHLESLGWLVRRNADITLTMP